MPQKLRRYPEYRDPGIPWLGKIPAHWKVKRLKRLIKNVADQTNARVANEIYIALENVESWTGKLLPGSDDAEFEGLVKRFEPEDVLFGKLRPYLAKVARPAHRGVCVGEFFVLRETGGVVNPEFLERLLRTAPFIHMVNSSTFGAKMPRADWNFVGNVEIAYPPRQEQEYIVRFLNHTDELVDRLIDTKQRLVEVLTEQKQATIRRAVTHGLDPSVPMKRTNVDWLPEVPKHWEVVSLRRFSESKCDGPFGSGLKSSHYVDQGVRVVRLQNIGHSEFVDKDAAYISPDHYASLGDHDVRPGDLLIAGLGDEGVPAGRACVAPGDIQPAMVKADCFRFRLKTSQVVPQFMALQLSVTAGVASAILSTGATRQRVNLQSTAGRVVAVPPLHEQNKIAVFAQEATWPMDKAIARARREIELVREYRTRLIADVVTGKLDVREEVKVTKPKKANKHFHRAVLAAEIVDQYQGLSKFGWIKLHKAVILAERHLQMDEIQSEPQRAVAGPFDNPMMRSIHKQLAAQKWFEPAKGPRGYTYVPMDKRGGQRRTSKLTGGTSATSSTAS